MGGALVYSLCLRRARAMSRGNARPRVSGGLQRMPGLKQNVSGLDLSAPAARSLNGVPPTATETDKGGKET
jgi:hypothetical protein